MTFDEQHELERVRHANAQALETFKADRALFAERSLSLQRAVLEYAQRCCQSNANSSLHDALRAS